jgi:hypothetical protein
MKDLLIKHPQLKYMGSPSWPPVPPGAADDPSRPEPAVPIGGGALRRATIFRTHGYGGLPDHLELQIEFQGRTYVTQLWVDNSNVLEPLREFLSQHKSMSLDDLGQMEVDL